MSRNNKADVVSTGVINSCITSVTS